MKKGVTHSDVAVYMPTEDSWIAGELPVEKQLGMGSIRAAIYLSARRVEGMASIVD